MVLLADSETDNLLDKMTLVHCIQLGTEDGEEVDIYADHDGYPALSEGLKRLREADEVVFHNGIGFDFHAINKVYPKTLAREQIVDTLVMARLAFPEERIHTLDVWAQKTGTYKGKYTGDFQTFDQVLVDYARQDIVALRAIYKHLRRVFAGGRLPEEIEAEIARCKPEALDQLNAQLTAARRGWGQSLALEHQVAWAINSQERNGFCFNVPAAQDLYAELRGEASIMEAELQAMFPPIERSVTKIAGASNKNKGRIKGQPYTLTHMEEFNPGSRQQIGERLQTLGWKPTDFGKDGTATVDEKTLSGLSPTKYPAVATIIRYFALSKKIGMLSDGKVGWLKMVQSDGRIHGRVNPNGACTGRMSHSKPNVAQADKKDPRMRRLFGPRPGWVLMGCDAEGLEARMLGHYLWRYDNGSFSDRTVNGEKHHGTDVHSMNMKAINRMSCMVDAGSVIDREGGKTVLYALMYGAGDFKLSTTVRERLREIGGKSPKIPHKEMGLLIRKALQGAMQGLGKLTDAINAKQAQKGYIVGLDGRHIVLRSKHSALNTLLQGAGAIVMKKALAMFMEIHGADENVTFAQCANVHDEVQMECINDETAQRLGQSFADCIREAGVWFGVKCPLAGKFDVGPNWGETH